MTTPIQPPPLDFAAEPLAALAAVAAAHSPPPVERWHPTHCGDSAMRIAADGRWYHEGRPIERPALVRLFASILRREPDGGYVLVTPAEKLSITVEDLPLRAVALRAEGTGDARRLILRIDDDTLVEVGPAHPLRVTGTPDAPRPAVHVRGPVGQGLEARLTRGVWTELVALALEEAAPDADPADIAIIAGGARFPLGPA